MPQEVRSMGTTDTLSRHFQAVTLVAALAGAILIIPTPSPAQAVQQRPKSKAPGEHGVPPTFADVHYGPHERQVLDFYKAGAGGASPLLVHIHGGAWTGGDKVGETGVRDLKRLL